MPEIQEINHFKMVFGLGLIIGGQPSLLEDKQKLFSEFKKKYKGEIDFTDQELRDLIDGLFEGF